MPGEAQRDKAVRDLDEMTRLLEDAVAVARGGFASTQRKPVDLHALLAGLVEDRLGTGAHVEALQAHVKSLLAPYKYPRWIEFVTELPKTATGKIRRVALRERERAG